MFVPEAEKLQQLSVIALQELYSLNLQSELTLLKQLWTETY